MTAVECWRLKVWHLVLIWWKEEMGRFLEVMNNTEEQPFGGNAGDASVEVIVVRKQR